MGIKALPGASATGSVSNNVVRGQSVAAAIRARSLSNADGKAVSKCVSHDAIALEETLPLALSPPLRPIANNGDLVPGRVLDFSSPESHISNASSMSAPRTDQAPILEALAAP